MNESTSTNQSATRARPARRLLAALAAIVAIIAILATPAQAWAHSHLRSARPAAGAKLDAVPRALSLTFSEPPELAVSSLRLVFIGADSTPVTLGALASAADPHTITASVTGPMAAGRYVVIWQVAGEDGHVVRGSYSFTIAEGAAGVQSLAAEESATAVAQRADSATRADSAASNLPKNFDAASPAYVVIRWAQFAGLLILIGAVAFRWWIIPRIGGRVTEALSEELAAGAAGTGLAGAWLLALTALLRLVAQSLSLHGAERMVDAAPLGSMIGGTMWGHAWLFEVGWLVVILFAFRQAGRHPASRAAWGVAAVAAICLAAVPALS
ncbi:MAG: copper resistance protein CopC, partial [Gemmatimonadales bacterium]